MDVDLSRYEHTDVHIDLLGSGRYLLVTNMTTEPLLQVVSVVPLGLEDGSYRVEASIKSILVQLHNENNGSNDVYTIEVDVDIIPITPAPIVTSPIVPDSQMEEENSSSDKEKQQLNNVRDATDQGSRLILRIMTQNTWNR